MVEMVIGVDDHDTVDGRAGQPGIVVDAQHRHDVLQLFRADPRIHGVELTRLEIDGVDDAGGHGAREFGRHDARSAA